MKLSGMAVDGNNNVTEQQRHRDIFDMLLLRVDKVHKGWQLHRR